ncbi:MAG: pyridoxal-phosphate dependent enzyme [Acidimicrobiia bacterium]
MHNTKTPSDVRVYDSILDLLPGVDNPTPLVRLNAVTPYECTEVFAKLEWYNPFGSVKDRIAANLIRSAEEKGDVGDRRQLVEPTSGNTGLAMAMIANARGYDLTTPLSNAIPQEKRTILRFFGANVEELDDDLCPAPWAPEGAIARAAELARQPGVHMPNQYSNEANPEAHYRTTGPEVWRQTDGEVTHLVAALGTCGTITGTGRYLKEQDPTAKVIGVHPAEGHDIPGVRSLRQLRQTAFFEPENYDGLVEIDNTRAYELCHRINREESIPAGPSSGLALAGVFETVPDEPGLKVVVMFPDSVFKYASSVSRHISGMNGAAPLPAKSPREALLDSMIRNARTAPNLTIDLDEAVELVEGGAPVIDVRETDQYAAAHVPGAVNIPLLYLPEHLDQLPEDKDAPILSICNRGNLSLAGVLYLHSLGYHNARSVNEGTIGWAERGLPVEKG